MARKTTTLETRFTGDDSQFSRVADRVERKGRKVGRAMASIFGGLIGGIGGFALSTAIQRLEAGAEDSITAFDRLEKSIQPAARAVDALVGGLIDVVEQFGKIVGLSKDVPTDFDPNANITIDPAYARTRDKLSGRLGGDPTLPLAQFPIQAALAGHRGRMQLEAAGSFGLMGLVQTQLAAMTEIAGISAPFLTEYRKFRVGQDEYEGVAGADIGASLGGTSAAVAAQSPAFQLRKQILDEQIKTRVAVEENNRIIIENLAEG